MKEKSSLCETTEILGLLLQLLKYNGLPISDPLLSSQFILYTVARELRHKPILHVQNTSIAFSAPRVKAVIIL